MAGLQMTDGRNLPIKMIDYKPVHKGEVHEFSWRKLRKLGKKAERTSSQLDACKLGQERPWCPQRKVPCLNTWIIQAKKEFGSVTGTTSKKVLTTM
eukprot:1157278-Pelagomonas_calceolata.AAC.3